MKITKEQLEMQALLFFAIHDFERSSLNDIAKALNVTKGAIYHYFEGKEDLFHSAVLMLLDRMETLFTTFLPRDLPFRDVLFGLFPSEDILEEVSDSMGLETALSDYKNILYLMMAALKKFPYLTDRMDQIYLSFRERLEDLMNAAIVRGEIRRDTDARAVAYELTAFYEGALLLGAFTKRNDMGEMGPKVCASIWKRIAAPLDKENIE